MTENNKDFIRRYAAALNGKLKPRQLIDKFISHQDNALKRHIEVFEAAFPCYYLHVLDMMAEGDKVTVRFQLEGIHNGEFMGIPPTGKSVGTEGIIIYQIAEKQIINHWISVDMSHLISQLKPQKVEAWS